MSIFFLEKGTYKGMSLIVRNRCFAFTVHTFFFKAILSSCSKNFNFSVTNGKDEVGDEPKGLRKRAYINKKSSQHDTALHLASTSGYYDSVEMLIKHGANVNVLADGNVSALHVAAASGNVKVAKMLLKHGAKVNARDEDQVTPLHRYLSMYFLIFQLK